MKGNLYLTSLFCGREIHTNNRCSQITEYKLIEKHSPNFLNHMIVAFNPHGLPKTKSFYWSKRDREKSMKNSACDDLIHGLYFPICISLILCKL